VSSARFRHQDHFMQAQRRSASKSATTETQPGTIGSLTPTEQSGPSPPPTAPLSKITSVRVRTRERTDKTSSNGSGLKRRRAAAPSGRAHKAGHEANPFGNRNRTVSVDAVHATQRLLAILGSNVFRPSAGSRRGDRHKEPGLFQDRRLDTRCGIRSPAVLSALMLGGVPMTTSLILNWTGK
jgi:hypothetical protein